MIHKYKYNGENIVLDINSGSVHLVDDITYDVLDYLGNEKTGAIFQLLKEKYKGHVDFRNELDEIIDEIEALRQSGRLFSKDIYEDIGNRLTGQKPVVKALCLHIAHDCNLKCKYCFAGEGEYHGARSLMSAEVGMRALDFIVENSGNRKNLEIDFFGGEPTINFSVVKQIVEYGREIERTNGKNFRFTLTTNAFHITDEMIDFCNANMHNIVLSLDGRKEVNDRMRPDRRGEGSYDKIVPNIQSFIEKRGGKNYFVRGTFTGCNLDFSNDVLHLADLGFRQISIEPVVAPQEAAYSLKREHLPQLFDEYERLTNIMCETIHNDDKPFSFFHFNIDLTGGSCAAKRISGCGAGSEYMSVTPEGDLYPCHQFTGIQDFRIGSVYGGIKNTGIVERFKGINVYKKDTCKNCWAKFYCSGGCAANAFLYGGDILSNYDIGCELQKKRVECAIYLQIVKNDRPAD